MTSDAHDSRPESGGDPPEDAHPTHPAEPAPASASGEGLPTSVAAIARMSITVVIVITIVLVATAIGTVLHHRTFGAVVGGLVCIGVVGTIWYDRLARPRDAHRGRPRR